MSRKIFLLTSCFRTMRYLKPSLLYRQLRPALGPRADFSTFVKVWKVVPSDLKICARTNYASLRCYSDKIERPKGMDDEKPKVETNKKVGPISWFNLGVSGVLIGVMMAFYYYARQGKTLLVRGTGQGPGWGVIKVVTSLQFLFNRFKAQ